MSPVSPEDAGEFGRYCHYRRSEDELCARLRMHLTEDDARLYEAAYRRSQEGERSRMTSTKDERMTDYFELRSWGEDRESAALRMRLTTRTAERYERALRQRQEVPPAYSCKCGCGRAFRTPAGDGHGYAEACLARWHRQGRPEGGPKPPRTARGEVIEYRLTRLAALFADGLSYAEAAEAMGLTFRSVEHYAAKLNERTRERGRAAAEALLPARPPGAVRHWEDRAACRGHGDLFFGPDGERLAERQVREDAARSLCEFCPVLAQCAEARERHQCRWGVWAGMSEEDRENEREDAA